MLKGLVLLLIMQSAGEFAARAWGIPLPGAVIGLMLMLIALRAHPVCVEILSPAAEVLLKHFALFLIPIGPSLLLLHDLWRREGLPIVAVVMVATLLTMIATAGTYTLARRLMAASAKETC